MHSAVEFLLVCELLSSELILGADLSGGYVEEAVRSLTVSVEDVEGVERQGNAFALHG
jgi:hypothetical protein